jgi:hypothetical protein
MAPDLEGIVSLPVDPQFPRYLIPQVTIDGPRKTEGELEITLLCRAVVVPDDQKIAAGEPIQLRVIDFGEPKVERDPGPIPAELLAACADRVSEVITSHFTESIEDPTPEELAAAVLLEIGRRLHPGDNDAVSLALGVAKLDFEKLTKTGDEMADALRRTDIDGFEELLATWKGQAHRDWSDLRALRRST